MSLSSFSPLLIGVAFAKKVSEGRLKMPEERGRGGGGEVERGVEDEGGGGGGKDEEGALFAYLFWRPSFPPSSFGPDRTTKG